MSLVDHHGGHPPDERVTSDEPSALRGHLSHFGAATGTTTPEADHATTAERAPAKKLPRLNEKHRKAAQRKYLWGAALRGTGSLKDSL